ncbi:hypothetical protein FRC12_011284 [Ceratobasidium sp. 428]|nr:hypothetical protein FRC12_011284 [Ceratobasidium sp. 428]
MLIPESKISLDLKHAVSAIVSGASVSMDLLRTVLKAVETPAELMTFRNSELAETCMRLLQEKNEHCSILDDEFSVLCLKIVLACIQVATLVVCQTVPLPQPDPHFRLAELAITSLTDRFKVGMESDSDPPLNPFLTATESVTLIKLLSGARKRFLFNRCAHPKLWVGWSFLLFPAWAHLMYGNISAQTTMAPVVGDLACRFSAGEFVYNDERFMFDMMAEGCHKVYENIMGQTHSYHLKRVDKQDSELAITATASRLSAGSLSLKLSYYLFLWASSHPDTSQLDVMVQLLKASISRLWTALDFAEDDQSLTYWRLKEVAEFSEQIVLYIMSTVPVRLERVTARTAIPALLNAALESSVFALLARALMFPLRDEWHIAYINLHPNAQRFLDDIFNKQLETIEELGRFLSRFNSLDINAFQDSHADWLRAAQHFEEQCHIYNGDRFARTHISRCRAVWTKLGSSLVSNHLDGCSMHCSYPRCPHPMALGGVSFACKRCWKVTYCSYRCQSLHWSCTLPGGSHADACSSSPPTNLG